MSSKTNKPTTSREILSEVRALRAFVKGVASGMGLSTALNGRPDRDKENRRAVREETPPGEWLEGVSPGGLPEKAGRQSTAIIDNHLHADNLHSDGDVRAEWRREDVNDA